MNCDIGPFIVTLPQTALEGRGELGHNLKLLLKNYCCYMLIALAQIEGKNILVSFFSKETKIFGMIAGIASEKSEI